MSRTPRRGARSARPTNRRASDDYEVGYGRPPEGKRWPKGVSGNPSGRPRRNPTLNEMMDEELNRHVVLQTPDGRKKKTGETFQRRIIRKTVNDAANGGRHQTALILRYMAAIDVARAPEAQQSTTHPNHRHPWDDEVAAYNMVDDYVLAILEGRTSTLRDDWRGA